MKKLPLQSSFSQSKPGQSNQNDPAPSDYSVPIARSRAFGHSGEEQGSVGKERPAQLQLRSGRAREKATLLESELTALPTRAYSDLGSRTDSSTARLTPAPALHHFSMSDHVFGNDQLIPEGEEFQGIMPYRAREVEQTLPGPHYARAEAMDFPSPCPERSWQDVAKQLYSFTVGGLDRSKNLLSKATQTIGNGARYSAQQLAASVPLAGLAAIPINSRFIGAVMGHTVHQGICVGVSTYVREMLGEFLLATLHHLPKNQLIAIQTFSGAIQIALQRLRQYREKRSPVSAARGFHNLSIEEWEALSAEEKTEKMRSQQRHSDCVTLYNIASIMTNLALSTGSEALGNPSLPSYLVTWDAKVVAYCAVRDSLQGLFSMVSMDPPKKGIGGFTSPHIDVSGNLYSLGNAVANTAISILQPKELSEARQILASQHNQNEFANAFAIVNKTAGIKSLVCIMLEIEDFTAVTQQIAKQAGVNQYWKPELKGSRQDMMRIFDQSIARLAVINSNVSIAVAANAIATKLSLSDQAVDGLTNLLPAALLPLQYSTVGRTWMAEATVRDELDHSRKEVSNPESSPA